MTVQPAVRFTPWPISTLPSGSSTALVVESGWRMSPTFSQRGWASVNSIFSTVPVCAPSFCPEIMNHVCETVRPSSSVSIRLAVGQQ